jgi:3-oxoacyl-ACP reductase-like protein
MSVFRNIMDRIFRGSTLRAQAAEPASEAQPGPEATIPPPLAEAGRAGGQAAAQGGPAAPPPMPAAAPAPAPAPAAEAPAQPVDVEEVLSGLAARSPQRLDWRHSIVDLMKLLDLDSSLAARKELAGELGYAGRLDGSAEMNLWLHRAVMRRLAENGGRVPDELKG